MGKRKIGELRGERRLKVQQAEGGKRRRRDEEEDMYGLLMDYSDSMDVETKDESHSDEGYDSDENTDSHGSSDECSRATSPYVDRRGKLEFRREQSRRGREKMGDNGRSERHRRGKNKVVEASEGSLVKARNAVVSTQAKWCRKAPTVICRVDMFKEKVLDYLDGTRKNEIREMGFGGFLYLKINHIPRRICYWIMSRVKSSGAMQFGDKQWLKLAPVQVQCVFGLPMGRRPIPTKVSKDDPVMMKRINDITSEYRKGGTDRDSVSIEKAIEVLTLVDLDEQGRPLPLVTAEEKMQYRTAFLIVVLGAILCPMTRWGLLSKKARAAVTLARNAEKYDWCTFVYDRLMSCVGAFAKKFNEDGFVPGCGGCSLFLLIFYLDHLNRPPVRWGILPRIKVWTDAEVSNAVREDKRRTSSDYGKLKCANVAYGDDRHPGGVKDSSTSLVEKVASEVVKLLMPQLKKLVTDAVSEQIGGQVTGTDREKYQRNSPSGTGRVLNSGRRSMRVIYSSDDEEVVETRKKVSSVGVCGYGTTSERNEKVEGEKESMAFGGRSGMGGLMSELDGVKGGRDGEVAVQGEKDPLINEEEVVDKSVEAVVGSCKKVLGAVDPVVEDVNEESSSSHQQKTPPVHDVAGDGMQGVGDDARQAGGVHLTRDKRPVKDTSAVGGVGSRYGQSVSSVRQSGLDRRFLACCRMWRLGRNTGEGCELIQCDKVYATQRDCYGVLMAKEFTSNGYVRLASALYTKKWEIDQFKGKSRRILMSPDFATRAMSTGNDPDRVAAQAAKMMPKVSLSDIKVLFVPAIRDEHWWCVAIDLSSKTLWIMDSIYSDSWKEHETDSGKIVKAVDDLLAVMDAGWVKQRMSSWSRRQVQITTPLDHRCCGVVMLLCIKACADRFKAKWGLPEKIEQARMRLLLEDAMSELNELKDKFDSILPNDTRQQQKKPALQMDSPKRTSPRLTSQI